MSAAAPARALARAEGAGARILHKLQMYQQA